MRFTVYPSKSWEEIVSDIGDDERDLISKLVVYESGNRLTADQVCQTLSAVQTQLTLIHISGTSTRILPVNVSSVVMEKKTMTCYPRCYVQDAHISSCTESTEQNNHNYHHPVCEQTQDITARAVLLTSQQPQAQTSPFLS